MELQDQETTSTENVRREAFDLSTRVLTYFEPGGELSVLGLGRTTRMGEVLTWLTVGAAVGAAAIYFTGPRGPARRRQVLQWMQNAFPESDDVVEGRTEHGSGDDPPPMRVKHLQ